MPGTRGHRPDRRPHGRREGPHNSGLTGGEKSGSPSLCRDGNFRFLCFGPNLNPTERRRRGLSVRLTTTKLRPTNDNQSHEMIPRQSRPAPACVVWKAILECLDLCENWVHKIEHWERSPEIRQISCCRLPGSSNCCPLANQQVQDNLVTNPCLDRQNGSALERISHPQGDEDEKQSLWLWCAIE